MSQLARNRGTLPNQNISLGNNVLISKRTLIRASCDISFVNREPVFCSLLYSPIIITITFSLDGCLHRHLHSLYVCHVSEHCHPDILKSFLDINVGLGWERLIRISIRFYASHSVTKADQRM